MLALFLFTMQFVMCFVIMVVAYTARKYRKTHEMRICYNLQKTNISKPLPIKSAEFENIIATILVNIGIGCPGLIVVWCSTIF